MFDIDLKFFEMDEMCFVYFDKFLEVFCFDYRKFCCSICFVIDYRKCDEVFFLDEIVNEKIEIFDIDEFLNKLFEVE